MTAVTETGTGRACLITNLSEVGSRPGGIGRALATGAVIRVDDNRVPCVAYLMVPPQDAERVLWYLGFDPGTLPAPGEVRDQLV